MKTEKEIFEWLEEERRKIALFATSRPKRILRKTNSFELLIPFLLIGIIIMLVIQQYHINELKAQNQQLQQNVSTLSASVQWYKTQLSQTTIQHAPQQKNTTTNTTINTTPHHTTSITPYNNNTITNITPLIPNNDSTANLPYPEGPIEN